MADHIPFVTSKEGGTLVKKLYPDASFVRVPLDRATKFCPLVPDSSKVWMDPSVDGMHDLEARRSQPDNKNTWFDFMSQFPNFEKLGTPDYYVKPIVSEVEAFVKKIMDMCAARKPAWITVPQLPIVDDVSRNRINKALATATGKWKSNKGFSGRLILPLVFTNQDQVNGKTARNPKVQQAGRNYDQAKANGYWVVDMSLTDDSGSRTLDKKRFPGVLALHEELNERIQTQIRIAGPYWGLNLVLWAKGLVDYPAIGVGSGYQYFLPGGPVRTPRVRVALPSLRRRAVTDPELKTWLEEVIATLGPSHPAHTELSEISKRFIQLSEHESARAQVAGFYKEWFDIIASAPSAGRSMALYQDLSAAYAFGKSSLPNLAAKGTDRRPEAVAKSLMHHCL